MTSLLRMTGRVWPEITTAAVCMLSVLATTVALSQNREDSLTGLVGTLPTADLSTLIKIITQNLSVAAGLLTGVLTGGIGSIISLILVGGMLGWSMRISISSLGLFETIARSWAYTPFELTGFIIAGAAGLHPITQFLRRQLDPSLPVGTALPQALRLFILAAGLLLIGAIIETLSIAIITV